MWLPYILVRVKKKGKSIPQQAEVAQGVPGRLTPRIFLTFRHYKGGRSSAKGTGRLYPRRNPWYSLSEAESTSGHMFLSGVPRKKSPVTPPGIDPGTVRLVVQRLNHYATPGPYFGKGTEWKSQYLCGFSVSSAVGNKRYTSRVLGSLMWSHKVKAFWSGYGNERQKSKFLEINLTAISSTTNPTFTDQGSSAAPCVQWLMNNILSHSGLPNPCTRGCW